MDTITGYRTNRDHTQTLAWEPKADGTVVCDHTPAGCCSDCREADSRLGLTGDGRTVVTSWPRNMVREGRTVRFVSL